MQKLLRKFITMGAIITISASMLAGCVNTKEKSVTKEDSVQEEPDQETEKDQGEAKEERPELTVAEHPQFVPDGIRRLVLTREGKEIFHLSKEPADYKMEFDYWEVLNPYDEIATVNTETMYSLFQVMTQMNFTAPVEVAEGTDTGIEGTSTRMVIDFVNTTDADKAKETKYADSTATLLIGGEDGEGNRYAAVEGFENQVYKLSEAMLASVYELNPFDYILKIPALVNIETVDHVEIRTGNKTYTMKVDGDNYKLGKKKVEKEEFTTIYQALMNVMLSSEIEQPAENSEREELLNVVFHRSTKDAPEVSLTYYTYDEMYDSVEINGKERFLVKAEDVKSLIDQVKKGF